MSRRVRDFEIRVEPVRAIQDIALPEGAHSYRLGSLGKQEALFVSFLFGDALAIVQVRHKGGRVLEGPLQHQRRMSPALVAPLVCVLFVGIFFVCLMALNFISWLSPLALKTISDWVLAAPPKPGV
jgi:hypothetical protein